MFFYIKDHPIYLIDNISFTERISDVYVTYSTNFFNFTAFLTCKIICANIISLNTSLICYNNFQDRMLLQNLVTQSKHSLKMKCYIKNSSGNLTLWKNVSQMMRNTVHYAVDFWLWCPVMWLLFFTLRKLSIFYPPYFLFRSDLD